MGDIIDDSAEEIVAEPDEHGFLDNLFLSAHSFIASNGWYIVLAAAGFYYLWRSKFNAPAGNNAPRTIEETQAWQAKEEQRLKAIERLQQKYEIDANARAEKQKLMEEKKRKDRLAELEALEKQGGQLLGSGSKSFKSEYNPLMGDSSSRPTFQRPSCGRSGG